jgi:UrcA family protein
MTTSSTSIRAILLRRSLPIAFAMGALAIMSARAHADDLDQVTISAPTVKTIGHETPGLAPIKEATATARVQIDPVTLTTNSGVALLKDSVLDAARKVCDAADPSTPDDGTCVLAAVKSAKPQIDAAVARARSSANG